MPSSSSLQARLQKKFEKKKPAALRADIRMISGCEDEQTSADVSNVSSFSLPDPAGRAGGACTSTMLNVLYRDNEALADDLTFVELLEKMRDSLKDNGFTQIPQLTSSQPVDVNEPFSFVPDSATGTRRALLIGINYIGQQGELSGCHNDVMNMVGYIKNVHGFEDENITILMDDGEHPPPTFDNIVISYCNLVEAAEPGDAIFCHYSGHGGKVVDDTGDETDGYDETLVPVDYMEKGMLRDDDIYKVLIQPMKQDVSCLFVMDCCHSGTVLDLPYRFVPNGNYENGMQIDENFDFYKLFGKLGEVYDDNDDDDEEEEEE